MFYFSTNELNQFHESVRGVLVGAIGVIYSARGDVFGIWS